MATLVEDRYSTATELAQDIERWLADEPVSAFREPAPSRMERWGRRHTPIVASAATLLITSVVALSVGILVVGHEQRKTEALRREAERQGMLALVKSYEATRSAEAQKRGLPMRAPFLEKVASGIRSQHAEGAISKRQVLGTQSVPPGVVAVESPMPADPFAP